MRNHVPRLLALLLSVSTHIGLALAVGGGDHSAAAQASPEQSTITIVAELKAALPAVKETASGRHTSRQPESPPDTAKPANEQHRERSTGVEFSPIVSRDAPVDASLDETSERPFISKAPTHYFRLADLTEYPAVVKDISRQKIETLPDASPRPARLRLRINEQGEVDQVIFDDALFSEQAIRFVTDAFQTIKFRPGKIDDMPVKSEITIEVTLEQVLAAPVQEPVEVH